ncbi:60S ribosomal export protein NMD3 [Methanoregula sp.]|uniref:60S ribosomal export protein NMD3 n=1 Tax=Methanoregula sp. TaxID=2052170 RepID=UPI003BAFDB98
MTTIKDRFCPKCGRPSDTDGLCNSCRAADTPWAVCDTRVTSTHCPGCGATKLVNTWTDTNRERAELAPDLARSAVHFHPDVKKRSIAVDVRDISPNRSRARLSITGSLYGLPVEKTCTVELAWHKEQCDRCNRLTGSYYEGIVQVRADERDLSPFEMQRAAAIATQIEDTLQAGGERLSFISDMTENRDGLDITVGSQHIGLLIVQGITAQLGGRYTTHPKLVGEKNGRQLFRITYLVRLPRYQRHDVVKLGRTYAEIEQVDSRHVRVFDLSEGRSRAVNEEEIVRWIGNARNAETALVAYVSGGMMGLLDPETGATKEMQKKPWQAANAGENVQVLRDGDTLVVMR